MDPGAQWPDVPEDVRGHVEHVIRHLLRPDEIVRWDVFWNSPGRDPYRGELTEVREGAIELWVQLDAGGERFAVQLWTPDAWVLEDGLDSFADQLEDFIAESGFGWGQQRLLRDRPWRA